jgi:hypothetical protein
LHSESFHTPLYIFLVQKHTAFTPVEIFGLFTAALSTFSIDMRSKAARRRKLDCLSCGGWIDGVDPY